jgi:hypothetical protein
MVGGGLIEEAIFFYVFFVFFRASGVTIFQGAKIGIT